MGGEKTAAKGGGFFQLFDWSRKSRKKLFSSGTIPPGEGTKLGQQLVEDLLPSRFHLVDKDEVVGVPSVKGSSDYSCASSVTDEEGNAMKAPGVVARLMGLDSLPASGVSEPYSTPLFDSKSLRDNCSQKRSPEFYIDGQFSCGSSRAERFPRKPMDLRPQKMLSSPIERFQTEILPPRSAKSVPISHNKLLSPIKNSGFISPKNAAHIMEAAAKILDPGLQTNNIGKVSSFGTSSVHLTVRDSKKTIAAPQRASRLPETSRRLAEPSAMGSLKRQALNKSWNGSEDTAPSRSSLDLDETSSAGTKGDGRSVSLAVQAKVNVQRREGSGRGNGSTVVHKDPEECEINQPFNSQPNYHKNRQPRRTTSTNGSIVLRQNNQKQNCLKSKDKLASKPSISNQQVRRVSSGDVSAGKNKAVNKLSASSKVGQRKGVSETSDLEREGLSLGSKNFPRKKRLIEREFYSKRSGLIDDMQMDRQGKLVQPNVVIDEHSRWINDNRRSVTDIVSFTFTSPMVKPMPGLQSSTHVAVNQDKSNCCGTFSENNDMMSNSKDRPFLRSNVISGGDALNILLEQKLKELTYRVGSSYFNSLRGNTAASSPALQESQSAFDRPCTAPRPHEKEFQFSSCDNKRSVMFDCGISGTTGQALVTSHKPQGIGRVEGSCSSDVQKETEHQQPSPLSTLEGSFSNESCNSPESWESTNENKICFSSLQSQNSSNIISMTMTPSADAEIELSNSASSSFMGNVDEENASEISRAGYTKDSKQDLEYVREILRHNGTLLKNGSETLEPLLFGKLESKRSEGEDHRMKRKVLFDCVNECLDMKYSRYFRSGYRTWVKGVVVVGKELAEELYKEITGWKSMGDWMVDELVDRDMSSHLGRWVDFEIEAFDAGVEIENGILSSLVDEVVADILT